VVVAEDPEADSVVAVAAGGVEVPTAADIVAVLPLPAAAHASAADKWDTSVATAPWHPPVLVVAVLPLPAV